MKAAVFHPAAIAAIRLFPRDVRRELGKAIFDLQKGEVLSMPLAGPVTSARWLSWQAPTARRSFSSRSDT